MATSIYDDCLFDGHDRGLSTWKIWTAVVLRVTPQVIAFGLVFHKGSFMRSAFNMLDLLVVAVALISIGLRYASYRAKYRNFLFKIMHVLFLKKSKICILEKGFYLQKNISIYGKKTKFTF